MAIDDPYRSVALDVAKLRTNPNLPGAVTVTDTVHDVAAGRVDTVVPPTPLREKALD